MKLIRPRLGHRPARLSVPPKQPDDHYRTPEHAAWRAEVLRRSGNACVDCGRSGVRLFADHVIELRDGGSALDPANGAARCGACHTRKTAAQRKKRMAV